MVVAILKRGNFVIPLAPLKIKIPMFARLSIHVPQIISISGNASLDAGSCFSIVEDGSSNEDMGASKCIRVSIQDEL